MTPEVFFNGPMTAHGVIKNRAGKVIRYFNADIKGSWNGESITLDEDFIFNDGEKQKRVWNITKHPDGSYIGTAGDVVGEAIGKVSGNSMFLKYVLTVPYKGSTINIMIDDRMYLVEPNILINESKMTKFGLTGRTDHSCHQEKLVSYYGKNFQPFYLSIRNRLRFY